MNDPHRPLITLALMTWNHERYVESAVRAALAQDYSYLEIILSDDASTDGTFRIVRELVEKYRGPHSIRLNRNTLNRGVGAHVDLLMEMAAGELVVFAAGDDISMPDRVSEIARTWAVQPREILCIASSAIAIDENGEEQGVITPCTFGPEVNADLLARSGEALLGATLAIHSSVFAVFGRIGSAVRTCEDVVLPFRAALLGRVSVIEKPLVRYRRHSGSLMGVTTPAAKDADAFIDGQKRMLLGMEAARRCQLRDLECFAKKGDLAGIARLRGMVLHHLEMSNMLAALMAGRASGWVSLLGGIARGIVRPADALKIVALGRAPRLWFAYIRHRAVARSRK